MDLKTWWKYSDRISKTDSLLALLIYSAMLFSGTFFWIELGLTSLTIGAYLVSAVMSFLLLWEYRSYCNIYHLVKHRSSRTSISCRS